MYHQMIEFADGTSQVGNILTSDELDEMCNAKPPTMPPNKTPQQEQSPRSPSQQYSQPAPKSPEQRPSNPRNGSQQPPSDQPDSKYTPLNNMRDSQSTTTSFNLAQQDEASLHSSNISNPYQDVGVLRLLLVPPPEDRAQTQILYEVDVTYNNAKQAQSMSLSSSNYQRAPLPNLNIINHPTQETTGGQPQKIKTQMLQEFFSSQGISHQPHQNQQPNFTQRQPTTTNAHNNQPAPQYLQNQNMYIQNNGGQSTDQGMTNDGNNQYNNNQTTTTTTTNFYRQQIGGSYSQTPGTPNSLPYQAPNNASPNGSISGHIPGRTSVIRYPSTPSSPIQNHNQQQQQQKSHQNSFRTSNTTRTSMENLHSNNHYKQPQTGSNNHQRDNNSAYNLTGQSRSNGSLPQLGNMMSAQNPMSQQDPNPQDGNRSSVDNHYQRYVIDDGQGDGLQTSNDQANKAGSHSKLSSLYLD